MPRKTRRLPIDMNRFNYWEKEISQPRDSVVLHLRSQFPSASDVAEEYLRERFECHLQGPCGERGCDLDLHLEKKRAGQVAELVLRDYITRSREWPRTPRAHQILKELPPAKQKALKAFAEREHGRIGRRSWNTLISKIKRDLRWFEKMFPHGPSRVVDSDEYPVMRKVWTPYARQAMALLGLVPSSLEISLGVAKRAAAGRQRARIDLSGISSEQRGFILHWFHHAFRDLIRYWNGHSKLPFDPSDAGCAADCRDAVRWSARPSLPQARGHRSAPVSPGSPTRPTRPAL